MPRDLIIPLPSHTRQSNSITTTATYQPSHSRSDHQTSTHYSWCSNTGRTELTPLDPGTQRSHLQMPRIRTLHSPPPHLWSPPIPRVLHQRVVTLSSNTQISDTSSTGSTALKTVQPHPVSRHKPAVQVTSATTTQKSAVSTQLPKRAPPSVAAQPPDTEVAPSSDTDNPIVASSQRTLATPELLQQLFSQPTAPAVTPELFAQLKRVMGRASPP